MQIYKPKSSGNNRSVLIDYKRLLNENPHYVASVNIDGSTSQPIQGIIVADSQFAFGATTQYSDSIPPDQWSKKFNTWAGLGANAAQQPQVALQSLRMSEQSFNGFNVNDFSINLTIPVITQYDDPYTVGMRLLSYCVGTRFGKNSDVTETDNTLQAAASQVGYEMILKAPNNYHVIYDDSKLSGGNDRPVGSATIKIGERFMFEQCLITSVTCNYSNVVYSDGKVTWVGIDFSWKFWRSPTYADVQRWHRR